MHTRNCRLQWTRRSRPTSGLPQFGAGSSAFPVYLRTVAIAGRRQGHRQFAGQRTEVDVADAGRGGLACERQSAEYQCVARPGHAAAEDCESGESEVLGKTAGKSEPLEWECADDSANSEYCNAHRDSRGTLVLGRVEMDFLLDSNMFGLYSPARRSVRNCTNCPRSVFVRLSCASLTTGTWRPPHRPGRWWKRSSLSSVSGANWRSSTLRSRKSPWCWRRNSVMMQSAKTGRRSFTIWDGKWESEPPIQFSEYSDFRRLSIRFVQKVRHSRGSSVRRSAGPVPLLLLPVLAVGRTSVHCGPIAGLSGAPERCRHRIGFTAGAPGTISQVFFAVKMCWPLYLSRTPFYALPTSHDSSSESTHTQMTNRFFVPAPNLSSNSSAVRSLQLKINYLKYTSSLQIDGTEICNKLKWSAFAEEKKHSKRKYIDRHALSSTQNDIQHNWSKLSNPHEYIFIYRVREKSTGQMQSQNTIKC